MKGKKKKAATVLGVATAACVAVSSLALFTDRFQSQTEFDAGSLDIRLTETWDADNAALADVFKPGTGYKLDYALDNDGNLAMDVRENFVISADKDLSAGDDREFDLYQAKDVSLDAEGNVLKITGDALAPSYGTFDDGSVVKHTLTYTLDELTLNGTGAGAETVSGGIDGYDGEYVLVFHDDVGNDFQEVNVGIEYMAQALQHTDTGDETWADAKVISEQVNFGGKDVNVVPTLDEGGTK